MSNQAGLRFTSQPQAGDSAMKIEGARAEPYSAIKKRSPSQAGESTSDNSTHSVTASFLGLVESEITPAVQGAISTLLAEIDDLRIEVGRLRARLEDAETLADMDVLTPALNRRALMRELHRVAAFSRRYGSPASLVFFDLDGFKAVNDRFGHAAGDAALKVVAERLQDLVRENDVVARIGGDEFAVILVQADAQVAEAKAASLATAIMAEPVRIGEWSAPLHLSYGVSLVDPDASPEAVIAAADAAMYARKRARSSVSTGAI